MLFNLITPIVGRSLFMNDGDAGATPGNGADGGSVDDPNSQTPTGGVGSTAAPTGQVPEVSLPANPVPASTGSEVDKWKGQYNATSADLRKSRDKNKATQNQLTNANQSNQVLQTEADNLRNERDQAGIQTLRYQKMMEAGIHPDQANLVSGNSEEEIDAQITSIQSIYASAGVLSATPVTTPPVTGTPIQVANPAPVTQAANPDGTAPNADGQPQSTAGGEPDVTQNTGNAPDQNSQGNTPDPQQQPGSEPADTGNAPYHPPKAAGGSDESYLDKFRKMNGPEQASYIHELTEGRKQISDVVG